MKETTAKIVGLIVLLCLLAPVPAAADVKDDDSSLVVDEEVQEDADSQTEDSSYRELFQTTDDQEESLDAEESDSSSGVLSLETEMGVQSVFSGKIPLTVTVTSTIDSNKAAISWDLPRGLSAYGDPETWFRMEADTPYSFTVEIEPKQSGRYSIVVDVTAWRYDTNYVTSGEFDFEIDDNLHVTPAPDAYTRNTVVYQAAKVAGVVIAAIFLVFLVKFGIKRFKEWMAKD